MTATLGTITIPIELKVNVTAEPETCNPEDLVYQEAQNQLRVLGLDIGQQGEALDWSTKLAAFRATDELVSIFAKITASARITTEDLAMLELAGIGRTFDIY